MRTTSIEHLSKLQHCPQKIRNICILAHVDHGKTTLADTLVASNGIISQKLAGKLRYLDSREDEQQRGITMKSSAISLHFTTGDVITENKQEEYLINLIDSPGHIDFSSEVSTAVRLCDGAVVLVDVVEGVCPQTNAVLRQAWLENIRPVLVLNKLDRLITELKMSPMEAYLHLQQILEQVNAITGELFTSDMLERSADKTNVKKPEEIESKDQVFDWSTGIEDSDDENLYFSPDLGNVVFSSAVDGWGFSVGQFAHILSQKLGLNENAIRQTLWGDFYLEIKTKRIKRGANAKCKKPLFVQFVLENLWSVYDAVILNRDEQKTKKIAESLKIKLSARDSRQKDGRVVLHALMSQWLPLSEAILNMVVKMLPSPLGVSSERAEHLLCSQARRFDSLPRETQDLKSDFMGCSATDTSPVLVFISKMFPVDRKSLPKNKRRPLTAEEIAERGLSARKRHAERYKAANINIEGASKDKTHEENSVIQNGVTENEESGQKCTIHRNQDTDNNVADFVEYQPQERDEGSDVSEGGQVFIAFARVFSGTVRRGQKLYVLGPKHDPAKALHQLLSDGTERDLPDHVSEVTVEDLYLFMGRELESLQEVPAGNILGIGGLDEHVLKSATMSSTLSCSAFTDLHHQATPIVRVAVEPKRASDIAAVVRGMKMLNQADACVQVLVESSGAHVLIAAGEIHLQKCLDDLVACYANVEVNVSKPVVPFRETIIVPPKLDMMKENIQEQTGNVKSKANTTEESEQEEEESIGEDGLIEIRTNNKMCCLKIRALAMPADATDLLEENTHLLKTIYEYSAIYNSEKSEYFLDANLKSETVDAIKELKSKLDKIFKAAGDDWCDMIDNIWSFGPRHCGSNLLVNKMTGYIRPSVWNCVEKSIVSPDCTIWTYDNSIVSGFQMATQAGPLCEEPLMGVCFVIEDWNMTLLPDVTRTETEQMSDSRGDNEGDIAASNEDELTASNLEAAADSALKLLSSARIMADPGVEYDRGSSASGSRKADPTSFGIMTGQIMSTAKEGCRKAFQAQPQRLMAAMYTCVIQCTVDALGKMYAVLGKRRGRVLHEDLQEGSSLFLVKAVLPVIESFGFAEEIRKRTSGLASPQLRFSHWEVIDVDPFWVPTTDEEYMHFGEKADADNVARVYMNNIRRRKGLKTQEKLVEFAEKQRTLKKNK